MRSFAEHSVFASSILYSMVVTQSLKYSQKVVFIFKKKHIWRICNLCCCFQLMSFLAHKVVILWKNTFSVPCKLSHTTLFTTQEFKMPDDHLRFYHLVTIGEFVQEFNFWYRENRVTCFQKWLAWISHNCRNLLGWTGRM